MHMEDWGMFVLGFVMVALMAVVIVVVGLTVEREPAIAHHPYEPFTVEISIRDR